MDQTDGEVIIENPLAQDSIFYHLAISARPRHWVKNILLFAPLLFSQGILDGRSVIRSTIAFSVFCMAASAVYILNDIKDQEEDRRHPLKRLRPIASGIFPVPFAAGCAIGLVGLSFGISFLLNQYLFYVVMGYIVLQILYTQILKTILILDVFSVAAGYFSRVAAGAIVNDVSISHWLVICTIMLSLFLALAKRRHEQVILGEGAVNHRKTLSEYSPYLLDQMIGVVTATTVISYILYPVSPDTVAKYHTHGLMATIPFVLYGIFRYLYLVHQKQSGGNPEKVLLADRPLLLNVILWGMTSFLIIYLST